jgi:DNA-binding NarL/FixJ family response regulator
VIVFSTLCDTETQRQVLDLGAHAFLAKPVDSCELVQIIEPLLPGSLR